MKPVVKTFRRFGVRLRPGGLLLVRPPVLRSLGWSLRTETILFGWEASHVTIYKKPTETQWRIERLRSRFDPHDKAASAVALPRTLADFRARKQSTWKPSWRIDVLPRKHEDSLEGRTVA